MKYANYLLPFVLASSSCLGTEQPQYSVPQTFEISFPPQSWALTWEQMKELRIVSWHLPLKTKVSLETCVSGSGDSKYFAQQRVESVKYFLTQGNPLGVEMSLCCTSPRLYNTVYVTIEENT